MDATLISIIVAIGFGLVSFLLTRWWSRRSEQKKTARDRAATAASQSRQVRRARERRKHR
ncbi:MAG TPA: hypothetical protein VGM74_16060 [Burkholderiaceae bacterium]|jgi:hypothetical protein